MFALLFMRTAIQILLLLFPYVNWAQSSFSARSPYNHISCLLENIECEDSNCFINGIIALRNGNSIKVGQLNILLTQSNTILDSSNCCSNLNYDYWTCIDCIKKSGANEWISTGQIDSLDTPFFKGVHLSRIDSNGLVKTIQVYSDSSATLLANGKQVIYNSQGEIFIVASVQDTFYNVQILLLKIDSNGNLIWKKHYGVPVLRDEPGSMIAISSNRYLIGYARNNLSNWGGVGTLQTNSRIMMIDSAGNKLSEWSDNTDSTFVPRSLIKTFDGGYAFVTDHKQYTNSSDVFTQPVIVKLDSSFNTQWAKQYGPTDYQTFLYKIVELTDSTLITAGTIWAGDSSHYNTAGWFLKLNSSGDTIWSRTYSKVYTTFSENVIYDFEILNDGSIIGVGQSSDHNAQTQGQQGWIIRVDSMGCLIPGCDTLTTTDIKESPSDIIGVKIYPNPTSDIIYILLKSDNIIENVSFKILDINFKIIAEHRDAKVDVTYVIDTEEYPAGTYYILLYQNGAVLLSRTVVKI